MVLVSKYGDLSSTITRSENAWSAQVAVQGDPDSALTDAVRYVTAMSAKVAAVKIAYDLFGTDVRQSGLRWLSVNAQED